MKGESWQMGEIKKGGRDQSVEVEKMVEKDLETEESRPGQRQRGILLTR